MAFVLWTDEDTGIDLGNPLELFAAFAEITRAVGEGNEAYAQLLAVPETDEEVVEPEFAAAVAEQAAKALEEFEGEFGEHAQWILTELAKLNG